jgi:hypothetical protein
MLPECGLSKAHILFRRGDIQRGQVFFREAILFIAPFVQVHATIVTACDTAEECHTVLSRPVACAHEICSTPRGWGTVHHSNASGGVFPPVISDI